MHDLAGESAFPALWIGDLGGVADREKVGGTPDHGRSNRSPIAVLSWWRNRGDLRARRPVSRVLSAPSHGFPWCRGWTAIPLGRPLPDASRDRPGRRRGNALRPSEEGRVPPLFGLAPGGVCPATPVTGGAVRSYRTLSPLPDARKIGGRAVYFLWHFPWGRPRRTLSGTVFPWSPDFPPSGQSPKSGRPAVWRGAHHKPGGRRCHGAKMGRGGIVPERPSKGRGACGALPPGPQPGAGRTEPDGGDVRTPNRTIYRFRLGKCPCFPAEDHSATWNHRRDVLR